MHLRSSYDKTEIKKMNIIMLMIIIINNNHQFFQYLLSIKNLTKTFDCELTLCNNNRTPETDLLTGATHFLRTRKNAIDKKALEQFDLER